MEGLEQEPLGSPLAASHLEHPAAALLGLSISLGLCQPGPVSILAFHDATEAVCFFHPRPGGALCEEFVPDIQLTSSPFFPFHSHGLIELLLPGAIADYFLSL